MKYQKKDKNTRNRNKTQEKCTKVQKKGKNSRLRGGGRRAYIPYLVHAPDTDRQTNGRKKR